MAVITAVSLDRKIGTQRDRIAFSECPRFVHSAVRENLNVVVTQPTVSFGRKRKPTRPAVPQSVQSSKLLAIDRSF